MEGGILIRIEDVGICPVLQEQLRPFDIAGFDRQVEGSLAVEILEVGVNLVQQEKKGEAGLIPGDCLVERGVPV